MSGVSDEVKDKPSAVAQMLGFEQTPHPLIPMIPDEMFLKGDPAEVAKLVREREAAIQLEKTDPFRGAYDLPMWRRVDLEVARRRLEVGGSIVLRVVILGGIRSAKTNFAARRLDQHLIYGHEPWVWAMHETEASSQTVGQKWVYHYLPAQYKTESGKVKSGAIKLNYTPGKGFTGDQFSIGKRVCEFRFYGSSYASQQGAELTMAWGDELVPPDVANTMMERVLTRAKDMNQPHMMRKVQEALSYLEVGRQCPGELLAAVYHGTILLTFTPKEGYSPMVSEVLDGAVTVEEVEAELLPDGKGGFQKAPVIKRGRRDTIIAYFHNQANPFGNYEGLKERLVGASEDEIRINAYGDVRKAWNNIFEKFRDTVHVVPLERVPRRGSFYHRVDPCDSRNFFMTWWLVSGNKHFCVREWPQEGDYIPGVGDPGAWARHSKKGKMDGEPGPAQQGFGFGFSDYVAEIERVELELGEWFYGERGRRIDVFERNMDSRYGNAPTMAKDESTTLIEQFEEYGLYFEPAPAEHLVEGINMIKDALAYNESKPIDALNSPHLFIVSHCKAMIYAFQNWTGKDGQKGACKDPVDTARYHFLADAQDMEDEPLMVVRARGVY